MEEELTLEEHVAGLYLSYACRALLGGGKGMFVMLELHDQSPEHYRLIMEAAKKHLLKTHPELREDIMKRERQIEALTQDLVRERSN